MDTKTQTKKKAKILVCDDDLGILETIGIILESQNFDVKTTPNGKGIKKTILNFKPNLFLLDIWMPGIDGKEITKILKRDPETKNIPIIIVSALNDTESIARDAGADGHLPKPFTITELLQVIERHLKKD